MLFNFQKLITRYCRCHSDVLINSNLYCL